MSGQGTTESRVVTVMVTFQVKPKVNVTDKAWEHMALLHWAIVWHSKGLARQGVRWRAPIRRMPSVTGDGLVRRWRCHSGRV